MDAQNYLSKMKDIYYNIISFIEKETDENFNNSEIILFLDSNDKKSLLKEILKIILHIGNNHHRTPNFFSQIETVILSLKEEILQNFTKIELFKIFKTNKRILLILIESNMIEVDKTIAQKIIKQKSNQFYFYQELKSFLDETKNPIIIEDELNIFNNKRKIGENDSYICELIRNDSVKEFITYVNRNNISLSNSIKSSMYETNQFLLDKENINLIEYSVFYGSIQIFKYLCFNGVDLSSSSLWLFAIHGKNPELIHYLEGNVVTNNNFSMNKCIFESIKCHHNDFAQYFIDNYNSNEVNEELISNIVEFYNFHFYPKEINEMMLFNLCRFDCKILAKIVMETVKMDFNCLTTFTNSHILKRFFLI